MAKQRGIHQLKGKVGGMSYYQQAGVSQGLVRRIPEGLSNRVKTAEEYANTRLNNDEFKNANWIATFLFNAVPNRRSSMMRRFALANMTKRALEYIKAGSGFWGQRIPTDVMDAIAVDLLENQSKSGPYSGEFGQFSVTVGANGQRTVTLIYDEAVATNLAALGIDGFNLLTVSGAMAEVTVDGFARQHFGVSGIGVHNEELDPSGSNPDATVFVPGPQTLGLSPAGYNAALGAANNGMFSIVTILPYRRINSVPHSLYEYATFAVIPLGPLPTE